MGKEFNGTNAPLEKTKTPANQGGSLARQLVKRGDNRSRDWL